MSSLEKDHSMIDTCYLKNVVSLFQTILNFKLSEKKSKFVSLICYY